MMAFKFASVTLEGRKRGTARDKEDGPDTELETDEEMGWDLTGTQ